jgi:8-oxo-dGTP diphosphatase
MRSSREYPDRPIPGVGAVVLRRADGRVEVLLVRLPGGAIEVGETVREACVRETLEETGIAVEALAEIETVDIIHRDAEGRVQYHYLVVDVLCRVIEGQLRAGTDVSEVVWADVQRVLECGDFALTARACTVIRSALTMDEGLE